MNINAQRGPGPPDLMRCVVFDLEGTLSNDSHRRTFWDNKDYARWNELFINDPPNQEIVRLFTAFAMIEFKPIILSAKSIQYRSLVTEWLKRWMPHHPRLTPPKIIMRPRKDQRTSPEFKWDMLKNIAQQIEFVVDDRLDVCEKLSSHGITCLHYCGGSTFYELKDDQGPTQISQRFDQDP